jgi:hypothetical protein
LINQSWSFLCKFKPTPTLTLKNRFITTSHQFKLIFTQDQWFITLSTQLVGFSLGGITRRFLVIPASMSALH